MNKMNTTQIFVLPNYGIAKSRQFQYASKMDRWYDYDARLLLQIYYVKSIVIKLLHDTKHHILVKHYLKSNNIRARHRRHSVSRHNQ